MSKRLALQNLEALGANPYTGRGLVVGLNKNGNNFVQVYWVTGRSENSRNRVFECEDGGLFTVPADPSKVKDPSLIIYNAMRERGRYFVVSNGEQTDTVIRGTYTGHSFYWALSTWSFEPDAPNYTPRIAGISYLSSNPRMELAILRKSPWSGSCERTFYSYDELEPGFGHGLVTYSGDGDPLPSFSDNPLFLPLEGNADMIAKTYWATLQEPNRVALAVKFIDAASGKSDITIINRFEKISTPA
jgi:IMP cyclohydrolase